MTHQPFSIEKEEVGSRLDTCLAARLGISRNQSQRRIKEGGVTINGKIANAHYMVKEGDSVEVSAVSSVGEVDLAAEPLGPAPEVKVMDETDDWAVINKPAGLLVHPSATSREPTLVDWLCAAYPAIRKVGDDLSRPGIVHRLDREVSGLMVIAKTQPMFDALKEQFKARQVKKTYCALVYGSDMPEEGTINFRIERSSQGHRMAAKPVSQTGREAITEFRVLKHFHNYTLLEIEIKTGRTHQIRAHLSAYNHPIIGDDLYGRAKQREMNKKFALGRIFLVATKLAFRDLADERQEFSAPLPEDLERVLTTLK